MNKRILQTVVTFKKRIRKEVTVSDFRQFCVKERGFRPTNQECLVFISLMSHDLGFTQTYRLKDRRIPERVFIKIQSPHAEMKESQGAL